MKYIVIGLGNYGRALTTELTRAGHEVVCADINSTEVEKVKDDCASALVLDARDELALQMLPIKSADVVIIAIRKDLGTSVRIVALLQKTGAKTIFARADDDIHESILHAFGVARVLCPEKEAGYQLVKDIENKK